MYYLSLSHYNNDCTKPSNVTLHVHFLSFRYNRKEVRLVDLSVQVGYFQWFMIKRFICGSRRPYSVWQVTGERWQVPGARWQVTGDRCQVVTVRQQSLLSVVPAYMWKGCHRVYSNRASMSLFDVTYCYAPTAHDVPSVITLTSYATFWPYTADRSATLHHSSTRSDPPRSRPPDCLLTVLLRGATDNIDSVHENPTRCNSMQIFIYCKATLHVSGVTAPIIRSTNSCNRSLRYRS